MDELLAKLLVMMAALALWRVTVCLILTVAVAFLCVRYIAWFGGLQAIVVGLSGYFLGLAWDGRSRDAARHVVPDPQAALPGTSTLVATLSLMVGGAVWGAVSSTSPGAAAVGFIMLLAGIVIWHWWRKLQPGRMPAHHTGLLGGSLVVGYVVPVVYINFFR